MLCDSLGEISSIHPTKSNGDEQSSGEASSGSPSLPSLHQPSGMTPSGPSKSGGQGLTMKQMDTELRNLRRENFDLKLRLYSERQKKAPRKTGDLPPPEDCDRKESPEALSKAFIEKENLIKSLKDEITQLKQNLDFKTGILLKERDALASDLEATAKVCKGLMAHLVDVREYWRRFMLENSSFNGQDVSLLNSMSDWMNISQDLLNSSSHVFTKDSLEVSINPTEQMKPPSGGKQSTARSFKIPNTPGFRGMSSLGLINDMSFFNDHISAVLNTPRGTVGLQTDPTPRQLAEMAQKSIVLIDAEAQTEGLKGLNTRDTECQSQPTPIADQMVQTESENETKNIQTEPLLLVSKETQQTVDTVECEVQTDLKCIKKKTGASPSTQERPKRAIPVSTVTPRKKESPEREDGENKISSIAENLCEKQTTFSHPIIESTPKPPLRPSKRSYTIMPNKENVSTPLRPLNSNIPAPKSALKSAKAPKSGLESPPKAVQFETESHDKRSDDHVPEATKTVRVSLSYHHHHLLRTHLGRLTSLLADLGKLNKEYLILETISKEEFSTKIWPCLKDMRRLVNSSQVISHHFTVVDENSVLAQFERMKTKKANIEKAITQQMKAADKILRKAKLNIRG